MPAKSEKQQHLMGAALAYKRGQNPSASEEVKKLADSMSEKELEEMASKPTSETEHKKQNMRKRE